MMYLPKTYIAVYCPTYNAKKSPKLMCYCCYIMQHKSTDSGALDIVY